MDSDSTKGLPATGLVMSPKFLDGYNETTEGYEFETKIRIPNYLSSEEGLI